jgi:hypothetical protein
MLIGFIFVCIGIGVLGIVRVPREQVPLQIRIVMALFGMIAMVLGAIVAFGLVRLL